MISRSLLVHFGRFHVGKRKVGRLPHQLDGVLYWIGYTDYFKVGRTRHPAERLLSQMDPKNYRGVVVGSETTNANRLESHILKCLKPFRFYPRASELFSRNQEVETIIHEWMDSNYRTDIESKIKSIL